MSNQLSLLEIAVLRKLLDGDLPLLIRLRQQLELCTVERRELTGCGFYTTLALPKDISLIAGLDIKFGDVIGDISGLTSGAGFVLYIKDGALDMLEGYSYDEPWPKSINSFNLKYMNGEKRDWVALKEKLSTNT